MKSPGFPREPSQSQEAGGCSGEDFGVFELRLSPALVYVETKVPRTTAGTWGALTCYSFNAVTITVHLAGYNAPLSVRGAPGFCISQCPHFLFLQLHGSQPACTESVEVRL